MPTAMQPDPANPSSAFLLTMTTLCYYDGRTDTVTELDPHLNSIQGSNYREARWFNFQSLAVTDEAAYVGTSVGVLRFDRQTQTFGIVPQTESLFVEALRVDHGVLVVQSLSTTMRIEL